MKTAQFLKRGGGVIEVEYDELAPCLVCGYAVMRASVGGTNICPSCDMGKCRNCKKRPRLLREDLDGGTSIARYRQHLRGHDHELILDTLSLIAATMGIKGALITNTLIPGAYRE